MKKLFTVTEHPVNYDLHPVRTYINKNGDNSVMVKEISNELLLEIDPDLARLDPAYTSYLIEYVLPRIDEGLRVAKTVTAASLEEWLNAVVQEPVLATN